MDYSYNFGSNFPNEVIPIGEKKDIDNSVFDLVSQYYHFMDSKDIESAFTLYSNNKKTLDPYNINAYDYNRLQEELFNMGLYILNNTSTIIANKEPSTQSENSHWLKEF